MLEMSIERAAEIVREHSFGDAQLRIYQRRDERYGELFFELRICMTVQNTEVIAGTAPITVTRTCTLPVKYTTEQLLCETLQVLLRQLWMHEFDERFRRKGVRVNNPHKFDQQAAPGLGNALP